MKADVPAVVSWIAAAMGVISLALAAGPVVSRLSGETGPTAGPATAAPLMPAPRPDLSPILNFAPFGRSAEAESPALIVGETGLGLVLLGVTLSTPASRSRAIIGGGDSGRAESHAIGSHITQGAVLAEVTRTHVVLQVDGRLETLSFAKPGASLAAPGTPDLRNLIPQVGEAPAPAAQDPDAVIARYRAALLQDPQGLMDELGLTATTDGYRISDAAPPAVRQAGFLPGDLVTSVNGQKVGDTDRDQDYFDDVVASGKARVELVRGGQAIIMTFPLR